MGMMDELERMKKHLQVEVSVPGEESSVMPVEDPFHTTNITSTIKLCWWDWLKMAFGVPFIFRCRVKVRGDQVAIQRWMQRAVYCDRCTRNRIDDPRHPPEHDHGYHVGDERWCEECNYKDPIDLT